MATDVLVPLDGSALSEHALPYAAGLARSMQARVILLHARWTAVIPHQDAPDLEKIAGRLRSEGVDVMTHVCHMPCVEQCGRVILDAARELGAGLIVMATHGRGGLGRWLYGSVADQVLRLTTLPVVLTPPTYDRAWPAGRPPRVLVTVDGSALSEAALEPFRSLLKPLGAELTLLRVVEGIDFVRPHGDQCDVCRRARARGEEPDIEPVRVRHYVDDLATHLRAQGLTVAVRTEIGAPTSTISRVAHELDVDLIAMATHGRGGLTRLVLGSVATETLRHAATPTLLVRPASLQQAAPGAPDMSRAPLRVKDIMSSPVVTAHEDTTLEAIARCMLEADIGGVPVVDARGRLVGIVTESDFCGQERGVPFSILRMPHVFGQWMSTAGIEEIHRAARSITAREIMHRPVVTATEDEPVSNLVERMIRGHRRRLPVVRDDVPVGIVTRHDLLKVMTCDDYHD